MISDAVAVPREIRISSRALRHLAVFPLASRSFGAAFVFIPNIILSRRVPLMPKLLLHN